MSLLFTYVWTGKITSTNNWTRSRVILKKNISIKNVFLKSFSDIKKYFMAIPYETKEYKDFKKDFASGLIGQKIFGYINLKIFVSLSERRDTDNPIKPIFDAIEESGVIENDKYIRDFLVKRAYHRFGILDYVKIEFHSCQDEKIITNDRLFIHKIEDES